MPVSRKRKRGPKTPKGSRGSVEIDPESNRDEILKAFKVQMVDLAIVVAAALVIHFVNPGGTEEFRLKVPLPLKIIYVFCLLLMSAKAGAVGAEYFRRKKTGDYRSITKLFRWELALSVFIFGVFILVLMFMFDLPSKLAAYVGSKLSVLLSMAISGLVGNFVYDLVKRAVRQFSSPKERAKTARR